MNWTKIDPVPPVRSAGVKPEEMPVPWNGKPFFAAWQHQGQWVYRVCEWNDYAQRFVQVPGRLELVPGGPAGAPVEYWMQPDPPVS